LPDEPKRQKIVIAFDADDTLWHNENILWSAEQKFQQVLLHSISPEELSQRLYQTEMRNLSLFGYGAKGFVLSMIETAIEVTNGRISTSDIHTLLGFAKEIIQHPVRLLDNAHEVISELSRDYRLILISKGELFHQEQKIASSGLADYFSAVEIVSQKNEGMYLSVFAKHNIAVGKVIMVGNSLLSDINPILKLGAHAIHIPYEITWQHERLEGPDASNGHYHLCNRLADLVAIIRGLTVNDQLKA
jgi:putative hydrolase of the HAD superfamily